MQNTTNQSEWLHAKLAPFMGPALMILIGSSIFRGLLGIVIASLTGAFGTYSHWSPLFRLPIEIVVFLGVFLSGDICFANGVGNVESMKKKQVEILDEDAPKFKGNAEQQVAQAKAYQQNKDQRMAYAKTETVLERNARNVFGFISASYALNFILQSSVTLPDWGQTAVLIFIEAESVFATFFVIWYYAARFKADKHNPAETGINLVETAMEARLQAVADIFKSGHPSEEDLNLADVALPGKHPYKKFVPAMRKQPDSNDVLTTKDIFISMGVTDQTEQRAIRRAIKLAYDAHVPGVIQHMVGSKTEWRVTGEAYYKVLKKFLSDGQGVDKVRTNHARQRPSRLALTGQAPDSDHTLTGHQNGSGTPDPPQAPIQAIGSEWGWNINEPTITTLSPANDLAASE